MIFGIGVDITDVKRLKKWVESEDMLNRFFNSKEIKDFKSEQKACEHYAARFAAKEAFGKAMGTGLAGFEIKDVCVQNDENGAPFLILENTALHLFNEKCKDCKIHLSLSHEKDFAIAYVIIEGGR